jgi:hypothetical protein
MERNRKRVFGLKGRFCQPRAQPWEIETTMRRP